MDELELLAAAVMAVICVLGIFANALALITLTLGSWHKGQRSRWAYRKTKVPGFINERTSITRINELFALVTGLKLE